MDKLIENSRLDCPLDQQIKVLERCLQVVTYPGENWQKKEVGWLLLARVLEKCSPECLRAGQSRLGKRLVDIASNPTLSSAVFVRQLLVRNPQTGELHATSVEKIVLALLDEAVRDECSNMSELAAEIFAIRYGNSKSDVLLSTLDVLLRQKFIGSEERQGLLNIGCLGMKQYVVPLTKYLFHLLSVCFEHSRQGELLNRDKFLGVIELGLNSAVARDTALHTLESFCRTAKKAALPVIPLISSMLVSQLKEPSAALFSALAEIAQQYGSSSTLHKHFYVIFEVLKHPLDQQAYGEESGRLIAAIVRTSGFLIQPEILIAVQQAVCRQFALHPNAAVYRKLMTVFLLNTHPLIPPPIHVARSVIKNHSDDQLSSICDLISRPRIMNLDAKRVLEKAVSMKTREENPIQMEVEQVEETVTVTKTITVIPVAEPETLPSPVQEIIEYVIKPSTSKPEKRPNPETKPAPVKKKLKKPELKTVLHEGEQSVDDIFDSFVI